MILDKMEPPPRYTTKPSTSSLLAMLPPHVLLRIVYQTFPHIGQLEPDLERRERQRKTLYWLSTSLRLVNRAFYTACMHVLRSTYLPVYLSLVRPPHTSDPFPVANDFSPGAAPLYTPGSSRPLANAPADALHSIQRESAILDLFIVLKVHEDVWADDTELHLERHESFRDLFDLHQPRSRLEDLVRTYGAQDGVITLQNAPSPSSSIYSTPSVSTTTLAGPSKSQQSPRSPQSPRSASRPLFSFWKSSPRASTSAVVQSPSTAPSIVPIPFYQLSVSLTPRKVGLVLIERQRKRTIVEVQRDKRDRLENTARQLVSELRCWLQLR